MRLWEWRRAGKILGIPSQVPSFCVSTTSVQPPRPKLRIYASLKRSNRLLPAQTHLNASILPSIRLAPVVIVPAVIAAVFEILLRVIVARHVILVVVVIVVDFLIFRREVVVVAGLGHFFVVVGTAAVGELFEEVAGALGGFVGGGWRAVVGAEGGFFIEGGEVEFLFAGGGDGGRGGLRVEGCPELLREKFEDYVRLSENSRRNDPKAL